MSFSATELDAHVLKREMAREVLGSAGNLRLPVTGWSMLPTVWPGDVLIIERVARDAIAEGDIVVFGRDRRFVGHRVVKLGNTAANTGIVTRGDALAKADGPVAESELLGRVSFILRNGRCIEPARNPRFPERAVAAVLQRSGMAARLVMRIHGFRQASRGQSS